MDLSPDVYQIAREILYRDGVRSHFQLEMDFPMEDYWAIITNWENITWVMDAIKQEQLGEQIRRLSFSTGTTLRERLMSTDAATHVLVYAVLESPMPAKMYEGTVTIKETAPGKTFLTYDAVYIPKDGVDPAKLKASVDLNFTHRVAWTVATFKK